MCPGRTYLRTGYTGYDCNTPALEKARWEGVSGAPNVLDLITQFMMTYQQLYNLDYEKDESRSTYFGLHKKIISSPIFFVA